MPQALSIRDALVRERDPLVPDSDLGRTSMIRRRFLRGEVLDSMQFKQNGQDRALFTVTLAGLRKMGFEFETETVKHPNGRSSYNRYLLVNPEHQPTQEQFDAAKSRPKNGVTRIKSSSPRKVYAFQRTCDCGGVYASSDSLRKHLSRNPDHRPDTAANDRAEVAETAERERVEAQERSVSPPKTDIDTLPMVTSTLTVFLVMEKDGEIKVGLRNGTHSWIATLAAQSSL